MSSWRISEDYRLTSYCAAKHGICWTLVVDGSDGNIILRLRAEAGENQSGDVTHDLNLSNTNVNININTYQGKRNIRCFWQADSPCLHSLHKAWNLCWCNRVKNVCGQHKLDPLRTMLASAKLNDIILGCCQGVVIWLLRSSDFSLHIAMLFLVVAYWLKSLIFCAWLHENP